jgi:hypothetical protein
MMPRKEFALKAIRNIPGKGMPPKKPEMGDSAIE